MGPLTFEARLWALDQVKSIQEHAEVDLINPEEEAKIRYLIAAKTWPRGWDGTEPNAAIAFENVRPDGSIQTAMMDILSINPETSKVEV
jgi:DNA sulfur modification protein DndC